MLQKDELMLALSYSGESNELLTVTSGQALGVPVAAFTCDKRPPSPIIAT
jgi:D-arabinose 5-phosphate isomerase GutQ